jgi:hypothetical protein
MDRIIQILWALLSFVLLLVGPSPSDAGIRVNRGDERGFWTEDHFVVLLARIANEAKHVDGADSPHYYKMTIQPLATLAGAFDASEQAGLKVTLYIGGPNIRDIPPVGATVLAVVKDSNFIVSDTCMFMPDHSPLAVVDGLGDRRVIETIDRLRKVRLPPPTSQPSRPPTSRPRNER